MGVNKKTEKTKKIDKITYNDISDIVEYLVRTKSYSYSFGCWAPEDIAQEIRLICFKAIERFDHTRVSPDKWKNFFGRCVDNALKNLRRDNYLRPPSIVVDINNMTKEELVKFKKTQDYMKWKLSQENIQRKLKILHPKPIDMIGDTIKHAALEKELEYNDLERYVIESAPEDLRKPLKNMLNGKSKDVSRKDKRRVRQLIKKLLA